MTLLQLPRERTCRPFVRTFEFRRCGAIAIVMAVAATSVAIPQQALGEVVPIGTEFTVTTESTGSLSPPGLTIRHDGAFVAVWYAGSPGAGIHGQRYDGSGRPIGAEFQVSDSNARTRRCRRRWIGSATWW